MSPSSSIYSNMSYKALKRIADLLLASSALIILSPLFIFIAFLIKIKMGSPVIFSQLRPGLHGKLFRMFKFRTMISAKANETLSDEERITRFGRFLRSSSLDELPELLNVIKGELSLIGPRPLLVEYLDKYTPKQMRRHDVMPGVTGLAQVKGRNELSWKNKFRYDVFYVDHISFLFDLSIIIATIKVVVCKSGFRPSGEPKKFGE